MADEEGAAPKTESPPTSRMFKDFLASTPPDVTEQVSDLLRHYSEDRKDLLCLSAPDILMYCESEQCQGDRYFHCTSSQIFVKSKSWQFEFIHYTCRNCQTRRKIFSVAVRQGQGFSGQAMKFGEIPPFGPYTPARVITLIGPDRELFLQGRRAENRGMGIGAYSYYRRVVENQKGRIIAEIAKVAQKLGAKPSVLEAFKLAEKETQFSKAIDEIKDGIPDVLRIGQHNPLTLLHTALSEGLHEHTDKECLDLAQEIRLVLTELAERLSQALKDEAELQTAVSRLLNRRSST